MPDRVTKFKLRTINDKLDEYVKDEDLKVIVKYFSNVVARNITVSLNMKFDADID